MQADTKSQHKYSIFSQFCIRHPAPRRSLIPSRSWLWGRPGGGLFQGEMRNGGSPAAAILWEASPEDYTPQRASRAPPGLQRPACPAAVVPPRWRRPGATRALRRTRTRTAAARRQRGSGRPPGIALRRRRRCCAAVRVGGQLGSALSSPPVWAEPLLARGSGGQEGERSAFSGAAGAQGSRGGALGRGRCAASRRDRRPFPGGLSATARPVGSFLFPKNCFSPKVGVDNHYSFRHDSLCSRRGLRGH